MKHVIWVVFVVACASNSPSGDKVLAESIQASYDGTAFVPTYGFATVYQGGGVIGLGDGPIHCGTESSPNPPSGHTIVAKIPAIAVGTNTMADMGIYSVNGTGFDFEGTSGEVDISAVTADSVSGTVSFTFSDSSSGKMSTANGTFEVVNCMPM